ncbi:uncharacterized protein LOC110036087 isoform X2 [Phalaenopsis equestris]|uniref:uncharacterized protein LOC110034833 isoform X2 n=1 Tax=Phalaenopsis equestris TaxID=78828 RepID=UPI0009E37E59|nr:uncharacterized protein LOC110034833 isoform X2 [Phalaenopsis equestris]XP_020596101.1 uncharacterized protein LOC110036087 isoform X2 [Phalaenopsis equestris]
MQRQSLGSPSSKLEIHGDARILKTEEKRKAGSSPASDSPASISAEDTKMEKPIRPLSKSGRSIHLVPILILLCFTILYIFSREPSAEDLSSFGGFSRPANRKGMWSHRVLKATGKVRHRRMGPP